MNVPYELTVYILNCYVRAGILQLRLYVLLLSSQEVRCRLTEAAESEAHVTDLNVDLNQQIAELLQQQTHQ